jgi:peroxiredoxin
LVLRIYGFLSAMDFHHICFMLKKGVFIFAGLLSMAVYAQKITLLGTKGEQITENQLINNSVTVFYFLSPECPLCQSYSLTMKDLSTKFSGKGIHMVGIVPGTDYSNLEISTFRHKYGLPFALWKDEQLLLSKKYKATVTPEAIVVDGKGAILYQGRIDNWAYELTKKRKVITEHNLEDALNSIVNKRPVKVAKTKAVGCFIE